MGEDGDRRFYGGFFVKCYRLKNKREYDIIKERPMICWEVSFMRQTIKLIALDLDGTILQEDHRSISPRTIAALKRAYEKGIQLVLATGRMRGNLPPAVGQIPGVRYLILSNGASIYDKTLQQEIYTACMKRDAVMQVCDIAANHGIYAEIYSGGKAYGVGDIRQVHQAYEGQEGRLTLIEKPVEQIESAVQFLDQGHAVEKINLPYLKSEQWELFSPVKGVSFTSSLPGNLEINDLGANKGAALQLLCRKLTIVSEETLAFGDGGNDVEMLEFAGTGVAMGNAPEFVQKCAQHVCKTNEEDGVAQFLERII